MTRRSGIQDVDVLPLVISGLVVVTFAIKAFTDGPFVRGEVPAALAYSKYGTATIAGLLGAYRALRKGEGKFVREFNLLTLLVVLFLTISVWKQVRLDIFAGYVYVELFKFAMPVALAYVLLNSLSTAELHRCMIGVLVVSVCGYLVELSSAGVPVAAFLQADFASSSSATESSGFAETALILALYFLYSRRSWLLSTSAVLFCLFTFKRLSFVVCLAALTIAIVRPGLQRAVIPRWVGGTARLGAMFAVGAWFWLLLPEQESLSTHVLGMPADEFTSGRSAILRYLLGSGFTSYGFGSATHTVQAAFGVPFEMDLIKIYLELGVIALIAFVWTFWALAGKTLWGYLIVGYFVVNMITSDSLSSNFSFTLAYLLLGVVNSDARAEHNQDRFEALSNEVLDIRAFGEQIDGALPRAHRSLGRVGNARSAFNAD